jgi:hypothetical protein
MKAIYAMVCLALLGTSLFLFLTLGALAQADAKAVPPTPKAAEAPKLLAEYKAVADALLAKSNLKTKYEDDLKKIDEATLKARDTLQASVNKFKVDGFAINFNSMTYEPEPVKPAAK